MRGLVSIGDLQADELLLRAHAAMDRRLSRIGAAPLAVAVSGGGDSLALLHAAAAWARAQGRRLVALNLDHRLQRESAGWALACAEAAGRLGAEFRPLAWDGPKPERGLPAAAREARHRLLAKAARAAGARVLMMGHTAGDLAEARLMRSEGGPVGEPREWSPSPAWPEGRGVFLLRPLLGLERGEIRRWLRARGETWIEDPANTDPRYARSRARAALARGTWAGDSPGRAGPEAARSLARAARAEPWGFSIERAALRDASPDALRAFIAAVSLCAGGGTRPPRGERTERLAAALRGSPPLTTTLAGARIEADANEARWMREAGEAARGGLAELRLEPGAPAVWDGRFEVEAAVAGLAVRPLRGLSRRLPAELRRGLAATPAGARGALPAVTGPAGEIRCPALAPIPGTSLRALAPTRLAAACGLVECEPD